MSVPEIFLALWVLLAIAYVIDSVRRLRRLTTMYPAVYIDILIALVMTAGAIELSASKPVDIVGKTVVIAGFAAATAVRIAARRRVAVP